MSPYQKSPAPATPRRRLRVLKPWDGLAARVLVIDRGAGDEYVLLNYPNDLGPGLIFAKVGHPESVYRCCLEPEGSWCECNGFHFTGGCRHLEAFQALRAAGKL